MRGIFIKRKPKSKKLSLKNVYIGQKKKKR